MALGRGHGSSAPLPLLRRLRRGAVGPGGAVSRGVAVAGGAQRQLRGKASPRDGESIDPLAIEGRRR